MVSYSKSKALEKDRQLRNFSGKMTSSLSPRDDCAQSPYVGALRWGSIVRDIQLWQWYLCAQTAMQLDECPESV